MYDTFPNIISFSILCVLLLIGTVLRSRIPFFQRNLIPASLIGGCIGLIFFSILGPQSTAEHNFGSFTFHFFTLSFLSLCLTGRGTSVSKGGNAVKGGALLSIIWSFSLILQAFVGFGVIFAYNKLTGGSVSEYIGLLSTHGFTQGPGQALAIGTIWDNSYGIAEAANIGLIFASFGFIAAFVVGIPTARWAVKRGLNSNKYASLTPEFLVGLYNQNSNESAGAQITHPSNVDSLAFHISILGAAYFITHYWLIFTQSHIQNFAPFGINLNILFSHNMFFIHGVIICLIVRSLMDRFGWGHFIDDGTQKRITGSSVDFMVVGTLVSIKFAVLLEYLAPILIVSLLVTLSTAILCYFVSRQLSNLSLERALTSFGCCTGSTGTGLLLLRIVDPDFSTSVSRELAFFLIGIIILSVHIWGIIAPVLPSLSISTFALIYGATMLVLCLMYMALIRHMRRHKV